MTGSIGSIDAQQIYPKEPLRRDYQESVLCHGLKIYKNQLIGFQLD
jgi:hypothetical protein